MWVSLVVCMLFSWWLRCFSTVLARWVLGAPFGCWLRGWGAGHAGCTDWVLVVVFWWWEENGPSKRLQFGRKGRLIIHYIQFFFSLILILVNNQSMSSDPNCGMLLKCFHFLVLKPWGHIIQHHSIIQCIRHSRIGRPLREVAGIPTLPKG